MVALAPAGETVGEMSLITRSHEHTAQLVALRDTELLRISPRGFRGADRAPSAGDDESDAANGASGCATPPAAPATARGPRPSPSCRCRTGLESAPIAHRLASALTDMGSRAAVLDVSAGEQSAEWFNTFEAAHDVVFYRGDSPDSAWTHQCLRQADRIFLLARADQPLPQSPLDLPAFKERASGLPELLLLHPAGDQRRPAGAFLAAQRPVRIPSSCPRRQQPTISSGWRASSPAAPWAWCWRAAARAASPISASSRR